MPSNCAIKSSVQSPSLKFNNFKDTLQSSSCSLSKKALIISVSNSLNLCIICQDNVYTCCLSISSVVAGPQHAQTLCLFYVFVHAFVSKQHTTWGEAQWECVVFWPTPNYSWTNQSQGIKWLDNALEVLRPNQCFCIFFFQWTFPTFEAATGPTCRDLKHSNPSHCHMALFCYCLSYYHCMVLQLKVIWKVW